MPTPIAQKTEFINNLLTRGVEEVFVYKHLEDQLLAGKKLRIKHGVDPTGPKIHLGRAATLWKLREFQDLGHKIIFIVGDFTARIGDPSDKLAKRPMLTSKEIEKNLFNYREQVGKILDLTKVEWRYNSEWLGSMNFTEIAQLAESFSLQQMLARRNFKERLIKKDDISLRELLYPLMQGYDSVVVKADVELGGFDQLFNLKAGRIIQPLYRQLPQDIIATTMLEGADGRKMSTSWGNVINITDSPKEIYGKLMSVKDELIPKYLLLTTRLTKPEVNELIKQLKGGVNPKDIKSKLAYEVTALYHSPNKALVAQNEFEGVHKNKQLPTNIPSKLVPKNQSELVIVDLLNYLNLSKSKSEAKRLVEQGGVRVDNQVIKSWQDKIYLKSGTVVQVGSRRFAKLK